MRAYLPFLMTMLLIFTGASCVSGGSRSAIRRDYDARHADQIRITVKNHVHRDVIVNAIVGGMRRRIGQCSMGSTCNWWLTPATSAQAEHEGGITLGWRWFAQRGFVPNPSGEPELHGFGSIRTWADMEIILQLQTNSWSIYPGIDNVQEA